MEHALNYPHAETSEDQTDREYQGFMINDDSQAEWAMRKISEARSDTLKWKEHFEGQLAKINAENQRTETFFTAKLADYFRSVPHKTSKTQEKYVLPCGELVRKQQQPEYQRDDMELVKWLESNGMNDLIEIHPKPAWGELKKRCAAQPDGSVVEMETGEIVNGVTAIPRPDKFEVKINE